MVKSNFYEWAAKMGHDAAALDAGQELSSELTINDVDSLKTLLQDGRRLVEPMAEEARAAFGELPPADDDSETAVQQRVNHFIYGNCELTEAHKAAANATLFPMKVLCISAKNKVVDQPLTLCASQQRMLVNYDTLALNDSACIIAKSTPLSLTMATLVRTGNAPATMGDINILGIRGQDGINGPSGFNGTNGNTGQSGTPGSSGAFGTNGTNGQPSLVAVVNITQSIQSPRPVIVYTTSGAGGNGGNGGAGGNGGNAGSMMWDPPHGGNGGNGGGGGYGGNGVDSIGNTMIYVAAPYINNVTAVRVAAPPGKGGKGGAGGKAGSGAQNGQPGSNGTDGGDGTATGNPGLIIIRPY